MASEKRRKLFFGIFLVMENIFLIVLLGGGVLLLKTVLGGRKSRFERDLARQGLSSEDYRARAPYVMFRPRPSRNAAAYSIRMTCFRDFRGFCTTVRRGADEKTASPGSRVWEFLPADARSIVEKVANGQDASRPDKSRLLARLNDLLRLPGFHTPRDFQGVELPDDARKLLALEPWALRDYEVARLNRHVLNAAFSATLKPADVIDSRGFWSPEISRAKGPGEFRVAMVGSSVVFCAPTHELSVVAQLAKRLKQDVPGLRDRKITYLNAGLPSGVSGQELAQFIYHLLPLNIDLLVAFDGFNDAYLPLSWYDRRPGYPCDYIVEEYRFYKFLGGNSWSGAFLSLFDPVLLGDSPKSSIDYYYQELGVRPPDDEELQAGIVETYMTNVSNIATFANARGIKAAVFLQPYSPDMGPLGSHKDVAFTMPRFGPFVQTYAALRNRYRAEAGHNTPTRVFNDLPGLPKELRKLFVDAVHYKQDPGNAMVAKRMLDAMVEEGMFSK